jgi:hypothetical protein
MHKNQEYAGYENQSIRIADPHGSMPSVSQAKPNQDRFTNTRFYRGHGE